MTQKSLICSTIVLIAVSSAAAQPVFTPLPVTATAISGNGRVVVGSFQGGAASWSQYGGIVELPRLAIDAAAFANDVNIDGTVIVGSGLRSPSGVRRAVRWDAGSISELSHPEDPAGRLGIADQVSRDGTVVFGRFSPASNPRFVFGNRNGALVQYPPVESPAPVLSGDGRVVFAGGLRFIDDSPAPLPAINWPLEPDVLPGEEYIDIRTTNQAGNVVAGTYNRTRWPEDYTVSTAALWRLESIPLDLGDLAGGPDIPSSAAMALARDVNVVVGWGTTDLGQEAFIWDAVLGLRNLRTYAQELGVSGLDGWLLTNAIDISDDGRTIIGTGRNPLGLESSWTMTVPAPSTVSLIFGILAVSVPRRRSSH